MQDVTITCNGVQVDGATALTVEPHAGGGYEGASRTERMLSMWDVFSRSADADLLPDKTRLDARSKDQARNDGYSQGGVQIHKDSIVGSMFKLNAMPNWRVLGLPKEWAKEFATIAESRFALYAESPNAYIDASRINTFTAMIRLGVGIYTLGGEILATAEWIRGNRPYHTAIQLIDTDRLCNPMGRPDSDRLRGGITKNGRGEPKIYHILRGHPRDINGSINAHKWRDIPVRKRFGRLQVIHILEQMRIDQSRGVGDMVAVLKDMKMTRKHKDVTLENAVMNALFAAVITSDLPSDLIFSQLGSENDATFLTDYMTQLATYVGKSKNLKLDGARIPHLFPGTKLDLQTAATPGGVGTGFEESLLRGIAAGLHLNYETFARDFSKTTYSSARASMGETWKFIMSRRKMVAERFASLIYGLVLEEMLNAGDLPLPKGAPNFYEGLNKEAYCACSWVGAGRGQIDPLKETQASILKIKSGLSTYQKEIAHLGDDYRDVHEQAELEQDDIKKRNLNFILDTSKNASNEKPDDDKPRSSDGQFGDDEEDNEDAE